MAKVVDVVQVVDISTVGLTGEESRQAAAASTWVTGIIGELSAEYHRATRIRRFIDCVLFRTYLAAKLPGLVSGNERKCIRQSVGILQLNRRQIGRASQGRRIVKRQLRKAAIVIALGVGNSGKADLGGYVGVVVLLKAAGVYPVIAQPEFVHPGGGEDMGLAHRSAIAVHLLNAVEEASAIGQSRKGGGNRGWASARAKAVERRVLGRENLIHAHIPLVDCLREHRVGEVVVTEAVCIGSRKQINQRFSQRIYARTGNDVTGRATGVAERNPAKSGRVGSGCLRK